MNTRWTWCAAALLWSAASDAALPIPDGRYADKVRGAWLGKCVGGALGMPVEGWRGVEIERRYPDLNGYLGYFTNEQRGWSDFLEEVTLPKDGAWHTRSVILTVPASAPDNTMAVPIIGRSLERHHEPAALELRNVRVLRPANRAAFDANHWQTTNAAAWTGEGTVRFDYTGERSWLKAASLVGRELDLRPGDKAVVALEARWLSGDNRIGFALDYWGRQVRPGFGPDDDTSYQIVSLVALEKDGPDLSARQIGARWTELLPEIHPSLAEGLALQRMRAGTPPPASGQHPVGEAIGGQMKGEIWGLVCPGQPDLAAEYARRDGVVAHQKNGVYGEQFVAAMVAQAFVESDVRRLLEAGLARIPADSEYARVVRSVMADHEAGRPWREVRDALVAKYPGICDPVFAEAGMVSIGLLYGGGDFEKSILIAARCGNDTDCNTATVGGVLGCVLGARRLPARWTGPVGDDFRSFVKGYEDWKITDLTKRIVAAGKRVDAWHRTAPRFSTDL